MPKQKRIALLIGTFWGYQRQVLRGIGDYARNKDDWVLMPCIGDLPNVTLPNRDEADGMIVRIVTPSLEQAVQESGIPAVNASSMYPTKLPCVCPDDNAVGQVAADYFMERGFRQFAFMACVSTPQMLARRDSFNRTLQKHGYFSTTFFQDGMEFDQKKPFYPNKQLIEWVQALPRPTAVFGGGDHCAFMVTEACRIAHVRVPEDLGVMGVDNDETVCELSRPTLSSVHIDAHGVGRAAAAMLDLILTGRTVPQSPRLLPPLGVVSRCSTDVLAIEDPDVSDAMRFIRHNIGKGIHVDDVVTDVAVSRRRLERRFRVTIGLTILNEIQRAQIRRACDLLLQTDQSLTQIAMATGFKYQQRFSTVFKRVAGIQPLQYRKRFRSPN